MRAVVHFSAFDHEEENTFIIKELAIVNVDFNSFQSWIFKPPFPISQISTGLRYSNDYLSQHVFGLEWIDGEVEYRELKSILSKYTSHSAILYTHGKAREHFLESLLERSVINLEEFKCPKYTALGFPAKSCGHHLHQFESFRCALKEASSYANFLKFYDLSLYVLPENRTIYKPTPISDSDSDVE